MKAYNLDQKIRGKVNINGKKNKHLQTSQEIKAGYHLKKEAFTKWRLHP